MKNKKERFPGRLLNVLIVFLAMVFLMTLGTAFKELREARSGYADKEEYLMMDLQDGEYAELYRRYLDHGVGSTPGKGLSEYYAVGRWYGEEFYRYAFEQAGLSERAEEAEDRQEDLEDAMGEFEGEAKRIRELFR